ncbi:MAG: group II intron reverse transcriptase/maturase, partial [Flavisolibacter sp.]|nr:group II intron reverse transcriptase/maturase [Flavisolibacter sp.]
LYLHHAFDQWMRKYFPVNPFERYADDVVVHCRSKTEAEHLLASIGERLQVFGLELHEEKTKLVYCRNYQRNEEHEQESFTFLSYSFQPRLRLAMYQQLGHITVFTAAISTKAKAFIRQRIREVFNPRNIRVSLQDVANRLNPKIRGWLNYYCKFNRRIAEKVFEYLNGLVRRWIAEKYKLRSGKVVIETYREYVQANREQFVHWQKGITY